MGVLVVSPPAELTLIRRMTGVEQGRGAAVSGFHHHPAGARKRRQLVRIGCWWKASGAFALSTALTGLAGSQRNEKTPAFFPHRHC